MILIEHQELASAQASITFSDIPQDYTDLYLVMSLRMNQNVASVSALGYQFNGATSGYSSRDLYTFNTGTPTSGTYTTASTNGLTVGRMGDGQFNMDASTANTFSNLNWYIPNYTSSNSKSWSMDAVSESNGNPTELSIIAGLSTSTSAITSILITPLGSFSFVQYSSATLYAVQSGSDGITSVS